MESSDTILGEKDAVSDASLLEFLSKSRLLRMHITFFCECPAKREPNLLMVQERKPKW